MHTLESLKKKMKTAEDLHSVVRTMKALAAVNIRQYERATESLAGYSEVIDRGFQMLLQMRDIPVITAGRGVQEVGAVVFGSDQGMCGQLNDRVVDHTMGILEKMRIGTGHVVSLAVGERVAGRLEERGLSADRHLPVPGSPAGITPVVFDIIVAVEKWRFERGIDHVFLFYSEHLSGASYRPQTRQLLPLDEERLRRIRGGTWPTRILPDIDMDWISLFERLVRQRLFVSLFRACAESLASENASRLASMQGAERNIEDRLRELNQLYRQQRQRSITEELLDIVSGYVTLSADRGGRRRRGGSLPGRIDDVTPAARGNRTHFNRED